MIQNVRPMAKFGALAVDFHKRDVRILILSGHNSCNGLMAQEFLRSFDNNLTICSANICTTREMDPETTTVMTQVGMDVCRQTSDTLEKYIDQQWDYLITLSSIDDQAYHASEFTGNIKQRLNIDIDIPSLVLGTEEFKKAEFRRVSDQIKQHIYEFYTSSIFVDRSYTPHDSATICYCSQITFGEIKQAVNGGSQTIEEVRETLKKHLMGECKTKNPARKCCHKLFNIAIQKIIKQQ